MVHENKDRFPPAKLRKEVQKIIEERCQQESVNIRQLRMGSRRHPIGKVRSDIAWKLANDLAVPSGEIVGRKTWHLCFCRFEDLTKKIPVRNGLVNFVNPVPSASPLLPKGGYCSLPFRKGRSGGISRTILNGIVFKYQLTSHQS